MPNTPYGSSTNLGPAGPRTGNQIRVDPRETTGFGPAKPKIPVSKIGSGSGTGLTKPDMSLYSKPSKPMPKAGSAGVINTMNAGAKRARASFEAPLGSASKAPRNVMKKPIRTMGSTGTKPSIAALAALKLKMQKG